MLRYSSLILISKSNSRAVIDMTRTAYKFDDATAKALVKLIAANGHIAPAARVMGLSRQTVANWIKRSEEGDPAYGDFAAQVRAAQGIWEQKTLKTLRSLKNPNAIMWELEKFDKDTYGKTQPDVQVNVQNNQLLPREQALEELKQLIAGNPDLAGLLK